MTDIVERSEHPSSDEMAQIKAAIHEARAVGVAGISGRSWLMLVMAAEGYVVLTSRTEGQPMDDIVDDAKVMRLWRECGLPEYFLGNGGTNHKLVAFAKACAADEIERLRGALQAAYEKAAIVADEHERSHHQNLGRFQGPNRFDIAFAQACRAIADDIRALGEAKDE